MINLLYTTIWWKDFVKIKILNCTVLLSSQKPSKLFHPLSTKISYTNVHNIYAHTYTHSHTYTHTYTHTHTHTYTHTHTQKQPQLPLPSSPRLIFLVKRLNVCIRRDRDIKKGKDEKEEKIYVLYYLWRNQT